MEKMGILGIPVCLKHSEVVTHLRREVKIFKGDLVIHWLYLANTYGLKPHKLIKETLQNIVYPLKLVT